MAIRREHRDVAREMLGRVAHLRLRARRLAAGCVAGLHRSAYQGFSQEFVEHRQYTPGDDLRHLDWKLFGRTDRLVVKQYQQETNLRLLLAVDCSESMAFRSDGAPISKYDAASALAAALGYIALKQQDAVGVALLCDDLVKYLEPSNRPGQWFILTDLLARQEPRGRGDLARALRGLADRIRRPTLLAVASDLFGAPRPLLDRLFWLSRRRCELLVLHVMDPAELQFPVTGPVRFEDMESDAVLAADPAAIRRAYRKQVAEFLDAVSAGCAAMAVDYQLFDTSGPLHAGLVKLLARRNVKAY